MKTIIKILFLVMLGLLAGVIVQQLLLDYSVETFLKALGA